MSQINLTYKNVNFKHFWEQIKGLPNARLVKEAKLIKQSYDNLVIFATNTGSGMATCGFCPAVSEQDGMAFITLNEKENFIMTLFSLGVEDEIFICDICLMKIKVQSKFDVEPIARGLLSKRKEIRKAFKSYMKREIPRHKSNMDDSKINTIRARKGEEVV